VRKLILVAFGLFGLVAIVLVGSSSNLWIKVGLAKFYLDYDHFIMEARFYSFWGYMIGLFYSRAKQFDLWLFLGGVTLGTTVIWPVYSLEGVAFFWIMMLSGVVFFTVAQLVRRLIYRWVPD